MNRPPSYFLPALLLALPYSAFAETRPPRAYDLQDVTWQISFDETAATIEGDVTNTLKPLGTLDSLWFDAKKLNVKEATVNGQPAKFRTLDDRLYITLPKQSGSRDILKVRIRYSAHPEAGVFFVPGKSAFPARTPSIYSQGEMEDTRCWIPTYDFPDDKATSEGTIITPKGYSALSNGRLVEHKTDGDKEVWHWKMDQAHSTYLISFVAGPYTEVVEQEKPTRVSFWVPQGLEEQGKVAFFGTAANVDFYSRLTGFRYPYAKYSQSAVPDFTFGGMENITATSQTINTLHPASEEPLENSAGLVAHELAHQWFGDTITTPSWAHIWINEGWASFLPAFWTREREGQDAYDIARYDTFQGGLGAFNAVKRPLVWDGYKEPLDAFDGHAYPGGASRMFMLMNQVGEKRFWPAIGSLLEKYKYQNVDTEKFFSFMSKTFGQNFDEFKKQWFYTPAAPKLTVKRSGDHFAIEQPEPYFHLNLPVTVWRNGAPSSAVLNVNGARTEVPYAGELILVDPDVWTMAEVRYDMELSPDDWRTLYTHAPNSAQKLRLLDAVMKALPVDRKIALAHAETSWRVLSRMLGSIPDETFQLEMTHHREMAVRDKAVVDLRNLPSSDAIVARLKEVLTEEKNDQIAGDALESLLLLTKDLLLADQAWAREGHQDRFRIMALRFWEREDPKHAREAALRVLENPPTEALRTVAIEMLGRLKDLPGEHRVYEALVKILPETVYAARRNAIGALANYGDKAAIPLIEPFADSSLIFMRQAAQAALAKLKQ